MPLRKKFAATIQEKKARAQIQTRTKEGVVKPGSKYNYVEMNDQPLEITPKWSIRSVDWKQGAGPCI